MQQNKSKVDWGLLVACFALVATGAQTWFSHEALADYRRATILERQIDRCADALAAVDEFSSKFMLLDPHFSRPGLVTFNEEGHRMRAALVAYAMVTPGAEATAERFMLVVDNALTFPEGHVTHDHMAQSLTAIAIEQTSLFNSCTRVAGGRGEYPVVVDPHWADSRQRIQAQ